MVDAHADQVVALGVYMGGDVIIKRDITIGAFAQVVSVDPYFAVLVDAVEVEVELLALLGRRECKGFAVPADAGRQVAGATGP